MRLLEKGRQIPVQGKTVFVAHRGDSGAAPENTMPAFEAAAAAGFGAIECDVWETGGKQPALMILHDENLRRMCGRNLLITKLDPEEIRSYPVAWGNHIKESGPIRIPFYEEYLRLMAKSGRIPFIEIKAGETEKSRISDAGAKLLMKQLYRICPEQKAVIQSFDFPSLMKAAAWAKPETERFLLTKTKKDLRTEALRQYVQAGLTGISMKKTLATSKTIARVKACGLKTAVWTVDSELLALRLWKNDCVDYLISNKKVFF